MMFLEFFIWGAWFVPLWRYLSELGFSGPQIGAAYSVTGWAAIVSPLFAGTVADRFFPAQKMLGVLHLAGGVLLMAITPVRAPGAFFAVLLLYAACYMPTLALTNAVAFSRMSDPGKEFPGVRVWGTIGWIASGLVVGLMPESVFNLATIENTAIPIKIAAAASMIMGLYSFTLPATPPRAGAGKSSLSDMLGLNAIGLLRDRSFAIFLASSLLICIPLSFYYQSANGFLSEAGLAGTAAKMTLGQASEIFFMLLMPVAFARLGVKKMLLVGMTFWVLRYLVFAFGNGQDLVSMLYLGIIFHGICYDFFFVTGQVYVDKKAPPSIRAGAQGLLALVTFGLGMVIGNLVNGAVTGRCELLDAAGQVTGHDWRTIWLIPAAMAAVVAVLFGVSFRDAGDQETIGAVNSSQ
jgi:nucleoside transporter